MKLSFKNLFTLCQLVNVCFLICLQKFTKPAGFPDHENAWDSKVVTISPRFKSAVAGFILEILAGRFPGRKMKRRQRSFIYFMLSPVASKFVIKVLGNKACTVFGRNENCKNIDE